MYKNNSATKRNVTYLWGDQEPCFYYACKLAQEEHIHNGYRVFKAPFTKGDFLDGYNGEECLLLLGLSVNVMYPAWLASLLGGDQYEGISLDSVKRIIITSHCDPMDFEYLIQEEWDYNELWDFLESVDQEYKVKNTETEWVASLNAISRDPQTLEITECKQVTTFHILEAAPMDQVDYFEKFDFYSYLRDPGADADIFVQKAGQLPVHEQRKLCAALEMTGYGKHDVTGAEEILEDLNFYSFYPDVLTDIDYGYYAVYEGNAFCVPTIMAPFFKFDMLGSMMLFRPKGTEGISEYGYIILHYTGKELQRTISVAAEVEPEPPVIESHNDMITLLDEDFELPF